MGGGNGHKFETIDELQEIIRLDQLKLKQTMNLKTKGFYLDHIFEIKPNALSRMNTVGSSKHSRAGDESGVEPSSPNKVGG